MKIIRRAVTVLALLSLAGAVAAQETVEYIHTDALGSPVAVSDAAGTVIERTVYEPYGATVGAGPSDAPGYTGHVSDSATGLSYMQQRYMDPQLGAFLSVDPISALTVPLSSFSRYRYANSNPFRFLDPDGRCAKVTGSNICGGSGVANAMLATSVRSPLDTGQYQESGGTLSISGATNNRAGTSNSQGGAQITSFFLGDRSPTFTYGAAIGTGLKAELKEGAGNDRYAITTPALGVTAAGMYNVVTARYDFGGLHGSTSVPVDVGVSFGGEVGLFIVGGGSFPYTPPGKFELNLNLGLGAAARVEMFEVGITPGKLP